MTPELDRVHHGDGLSGLASLEPGSVDLVLSDLPSGETAAPFDKRPDLTALWVVVWRALKPNGIACFMASSLRFASDLRAASLAEFRYDLVWEKSCATGHLNASSRPLRSHEFILLFWREPGTFHPQMERGLIAINATPTLGKNPKSANYGNKKSVASRAGEFDRFPRSVLHFGSQPNNSGTGRIHPQQKPEDLIAYLVRAYSNPGDLVVDPYSGSASTGRAAINEGRRFQGWDTDATFVRLGNERLAQQGLFG